MSSLVQFLSLVQIVEYEDYDNSSDDYQQEYEYEEEYDGRHGPAEREQAYILSLEVQLKQNYPFNFEGRELKLPRTYAY